MTVASIVALAKPILIRNGVKSAALFGSRSRGTAKRGSDVDILVRMKEGSSLLDLVRVEREIAQGLKMKVDLVTEKSLHPSIRRSIKNDLRKIL